MMMMTWRGAVDVVGVGDGEVGDGGPVGCDVVDEGGAASIEGEAAALARRRVGVDVVVVEAGFSAGDSVAFEAVARCRWACAWA